MNLSFKLLGYEIWTLDLDFGQEDEPVKPASVVDTAVQGISKAWVRRMLAR